LAIDRGILREPFYNGQHEITLTPGSFFRENWQACLRLSFATSEADVEYFQNSLDLLDPTTI